MTDVYVSAASSKEVPCKGERLGNHLKGSEIQLKDILMITQAKYYISISHARLYARACFYKQTRLIILLEKKELPASVYYDHLYNPTVSDTANLTISKERNFTTED